MGGHAPTALFIGASERALLAWYHPPSSSGPARSCGVLICNPVGDDAVRAHRPLRHLAERLARAGFGVLRFDFHGTGDSAGDERAPDRVRTWREDVRLAVAELRARCGGVEVAIVGLRLGATLAAAAAAEAGGVDSLVLWGPFVGGQAYVTESTRLYKVHALLEPRGFSGGPRAREDGEEAFGFLLTHATIAELSTLDLRALDRAPARRALLLGDGGGAAAEEDLMGRLHALDVAAERRVLPGSRQFLLEVPHKSRLPEDALGAIVAWLSEAHPSFTQTSPPRPPSPPTGAVPSQTSSGGGEGGDHDVSPPSPSWDSIGDAQCFSRERGAGGVRSGWKEVGLPCEHPVTFGRRHPLFGILHRPATAARRLPPIVLASAGTVHRIGPHRLYVALARRWAALGFHVLRLDLSGVGDSPAADDGVENVTYPRDGLLDLGEAMDRLGHTASADRFIVAGLCSGGDFAFQMGLRDPRAVGAVILNPRTFCVNDLAQVETGNPPGVLAAAGKVEGIEGEAAPVPASLRRMVERGVDTLLVVTDRDPGVSYVDERWGDAMRALAGLPGFRREDVRGADHNFTSLWAQETVSDLITDHLARRFAT